MGQDLDLQSRLKMSLSFENSMWFVNSCLVPLLILRNTVDCRGARGIEVAFHHTSYMLAPTRTLVVAVALLADSSAALRCTPCVRRRSVLAGGLAACVLPAGANAATLPLAGDPGKVFSQVSL